MWSSAVYLWSLIISLPNSLILDMLTDSQIVNQLFVMIISKISIHFYCP